MMPSKLTTILSVGGLSLVTANEGSGLHAIITENNMGIAVAAENQQALTHGIEKAIIDDENAQRLKSNARKYAEAHLNIENIMKRFQSDFLL
jgi:colanic acid biosynthesis glycosyl transferase WcaI